MLKKCIAEAVGTMILVLFGCGVAMLSGASLVPTALAFGLVIVAMAYSIGNISGCHINPAVSLAMFLTKKMNAKEFLFYLVSQVIGALLGALLLGLFLGSFKNLGGNETQAVLIAAYGEGGSLIVGLLVEIILTFTFVLAILGVTSKTENKAVTGIVIGLALTLVHLLGIGLTGTSVNPARSLGPAIMQMFAGNFTAITQIWIFIIGPLAGAFLAAILYQYLNEKKQKSEEGKN